MRTLMVLAVSLVAASIAVPAQAANCPIDTRKASAEFWPPGSIPTGRTETRKHPCGRTLACTAGVSTAIESRRCKWQ